MSKYIFVTGGVISGTGKGISAASIGLLLRLRGHSVQYIKFDPYLNSNAGTMSPGEHGETFLCDDGSETDLDLGHIERITGIEMEGKNITTSGKIYKELITEEEKGDFLGQTIQIIPHVTNKVHDKLNALGKIADIVVVEIGGCVGDIESGAYYEAIRMFKQKHPNDVFVVMVAPILWVPTINEFKTKPLQRSVKDLQSYGLIADMLICRVDRDIDKKIIDKVSNMTSIPRECVFVAPDAKSIYEVPITFYDQQIDDLIVDKFHLKRNGCRIGKYRQLVEDYINSENLPIIEIGIIGKYKNCDEAYLSLKEALIHAAVNNKVKVHVNWINAEDVTYKNSSKILEKINGVIVPGGFDSRGVEGKIASIKYCRENKVPFLGICLGLQCAVIEFARNVLNIKDATSQEFDKDTKSPVIHYVNGQHEDIKKSGTQRLGAYDCVLAKDSMVRKLYGKRNISERHRHRLEVNSDYVEKMEEKGFKVVGRNPDSDLVEIMELKDHPFFVGAQSHPEFRSRLQKPSALFNGLVMAAMK